MTKPSFLLSLLLSALAVGTSFAKSPSNPPLIRYPLEDKRLSIAVPEDCPVPAGRRTDTLSCHREEPLLIVTLGVEPGQPDFHKNVSGIDNIFDEYPDIDNRSLQSAGATQLKEKGRGEWEVNRFHMRWKSYLFQMHEKPATSAWYFFYVDSGLAHVHCFGYGNLQATCDSVAKSVQAETASAPPGHSD